MPSFRALPSALCDSFDPPKKPMIMTSLFIRQYLDIMIHDTVYQVSLKFNDIFKTYGS